MIVVLLKSFLTLLGSCSTLHVGLLVGLNHVMMVDAFAFTAVRSTSRYRCSNIIGSNCSTRCSASSSSTRTYSSVVEESDICIIGGGISGLTAAITCATQLKQTQNINIRVIEANEFVGGRVRSTTTEDGYILDHGFAVFIEEYPNSKALFDYENLKLKQFDPGAIIVINDSNGNGESVQLARVADPLRQPSKLFDALLTPVGTIQDKIRLIPLFVHVKTNSVEQLFLQHSSDSQHQNQHQNTLSLLQNKYKFSDKMIQEFFTPFLQGIYLCPLDQQSSNMFHFVFKMFADSVVSLPERGMQSVPNHLYDRATKLGVKFHFNHVVTDLSSHENEIENNDKNQKRSFCVALHPKNNQQPSKTILINTKSIICATESTQAKKLLSTFNHDNKSSSSSSCHDDNGAHSDNVDSGGKLLKTLKDQPQYKVGCMYYAFQGEAPIQDPVLILNGEHTPSRKRKPINNVCFPSIINDSYAPPGYQLCSVAILEQTINEYEHNFKELDYDIRQQLATWFPTYKNDILNDNKWERKGDGNIIGNGNRNNDGRGDSRGLYVIENAQPSHLDGPMPANVHLGRDCTTFRGMELPSGVFVCGDHMATATLNGAIESGINAAKMASDYVII